MDDLSDLRDTPDSLHAQKIAITAQKLESDALLVFKLKQAQDSYAARRQALLLSISRLDHEFTKSKAALKLEFDNAEVAINNRLGELLAKSKKFHSAKAFGKLPAEILGYIFEQCIEGDLEGVGGEGLGTSPRLLVLVCRFWYRTAMGTPSLWRKILVTDTAASYWYLQRNKRIPPLKRHSPVGIHSHSSMQICVNPVEVARALERTGVAPLEITLAISGGTDDATRPPEDIFYVRMYSSIFNPRIAPRIRDLVIESHRAGWLLIWRIERMSGLDVTLSNLASLQIYTSVTFSFMLEDDTPILKALLSGAINLRTLRVGTPGTPELLQYNGWRESNYGKTIAHLRELRVKDGCQLDKILRSSIGIETLILDTAARVEIAAEEGQTWEVATDPWPTARTPEITFTSLARLHLILDDYSLLDRLVFPALEEFRITESSENRKSRGPREDDQPLNNPDFVLDLPKLSTLRLTSPRVSQISHFIMPHLGRLHIIHTQTTPSKADADFANLIPPVTSLSSNFGAHAFDDVLHLYLNTVASDKCLTSILKALPSLETLHLVPGKKLGKTSLKALYIGRHKRFTSDPICPRLKEVELDCYSFRAWEGGKQLEKRVGTIQPPGLPEHLRVFLTSRRKWGEPLARCTVTGVDGVKHEYV